MDQKQKISRCVQLIWILGLAAVCYFPFINKALHIDSDMLVHTARQILENPLNPPLGDYGRHMILHDKTRMPESSVFYRCGHPPLLPAYFAVVIRIFGDREWVLHTALFPFYLLAVFSVWLLLGLFFSSRFQLYGTLLWTVSPSLLVNSHNLMWDVPIAALMLFSLVLFFIGLRKSSGRLILLSGIIAGLAALTKVNALPLYLLFGPFLLLQRKWKFLFLWCAPAVLLPMSWVVHNIIIYGKIHYISIGWLGLNPGDIRHRIERFTSFAGGSLLLPVFWYWLMLLRHNFRALVVITSISVIWSALLVTVLKYPVWFGFVYTLFSSCGIWLLWKSVFLKISGPDVKKYESVLIGLYSLLYISVMIMLPSAMVRYMLPLVPVGLIVLGEELRSVKDSRVLVITAFLLSLVFSVTLATADYLQCDSDRKLPSLLKDKGYFPEDTWYFGRLSFDYYLSGAKYRNLKIDSQRPRKGDFLVENIIPGDYNPREFIPEFTAVPVDTISLYKWPVRTMGFYGGFYGADRLPYSIKTGVPQKAYCVYELR